MELTESRKDFISHDLEYYKKLFEIYNRDNKMDLFMGSINCDEIISSYEQEKEEVIATLTPLQELDNPSKSNKNKMKELEKRLTQLNDFIAEYQKAKDEYGNSITLSAHVIMEFGGNYVEFIGEFDLVTNKFMYFTFTKLVPFYRKTIRSITKFKRGGKHENS